MDGCAFEQSTLIQCTIGTGPEIPMSSTECLNLNITAPSLPSGMSIAIPVMVFVHGGGFIMGANSWPQYDPARLVRMSAKLGTPVIVVNVNYRLGAPGNLTSEELRKAEYPGNNSLRDQRCALQWVRKHIGAFGGDADNVTLFGESAGAGTLLFRGISVGCNRANQVNSLGVASIEFQRAIVQTCDKHVGNTDHAQATISVCS